MSTIAPITVGSTVLTQEYLESLFSSYPAVDTFYFTVDGVAFADIYRATGHAQRFSNKAVVSVSRADIGLTPLAPFTDPNNIIYPSSIPIQDAYAFFQQTEGGNDANAGIVQVVTAPVIVPATADNAVVENPVILEPTIGKKKGPSAAVSEVIDTNDNIPVVDTPITEETTEGGIIA